jgi:SAM-dependent methyltransferase
LVENYVREVLKNRNNMEIINVLDLGCGKGESYKFFKSLNLNIEWIGLDIENSPEVKSRQVDNERFIIFDGISIPFPEDYFDLVYCNQVFEHVKYPRELLLNVSRVIKPGGYFIGSTSHLEPFHSYSYWNFTPYGFSVLIEEAKLKLLELRPSIDSLTLIIRRCLGCPRFFNIFSRVDSPLNILISVVGKLLRLRIITINTIKLLFCGQFVFFVTKEK